MKGMTSKKPYLIRAIYDWIVDNHFTPYILVTVEYGGVDVPTEYVKNGKIVLNISPTACRGLHIAHDRLVFTTKFKGVATQVFVVPQAVLAIYAHENGEGMEFPEEPGAYEFPSDTSTPRKKPALTLVKKEDA